MQGVMAKYKTALTTITTRPGAFCHAGRNCQVQDSAHNYQACTVSSQAQVLVGAASLSNKEKLKTFLVPVSQIVKHALYDVDDFDIAVLILDSKVNAKN